MQGMPIRLRLYICFVISLGIISLSLGFLTLSMSALAPLVFFTLLCTIAETVPIRINKHMAVSVNFSIGLASILVFQTSIVSIIGFLSMLLYIEYEDGAVKHLLNTSLVKRLFNASSYAVSLTLASYVYKVSMTHLGQYTILNLSVFGILFGILSYILVDYTVFIRLMSFIENESFLRMMKKNIWIIFNVIAIAPLGIFFGIIYNMYGMFAVLLFFGPLLLARYSFKLYVDTKTMYSQTIEALSNAIDAKDTYTKGHSYRVADYAVGVAKQMKLSENSIDKVKTAAILHDVGKIGIKDIILNKTARLEDEEYNEIKKHPTIGSNILAQVQNLSEVAKIVKHHHERYDGKGYPDSIGGEDVPIESYIISISDAYDAITSDRPYRKAKTHEEALTIIEEESGKQFSPKVVESFLKYMYNRGDTK